MFAEIFLKIDNISKTGYIIYYQLFVHVFICECDALNIFWITVLNRQCTLTYIALICIEPFFLCLGQFIHCFDKINERLDLAATCQWSMTIFVAFQTNRHATFETNSNMASNFIHKIHCGIVLCLDLSQFHCWTLFFQSSQKVHHFFFKKFFTESKRIKTLQGLLSPSFIWRQTGVFLSITNCLMSAIKHSWHVMWPQYNSKSSFSS